MTAVDQFTWETFNRLCARDRAKAESVLRSRMRMLQAHYDVLPWTLVSRLQEEITTLDQMLSLKG